MNDQTQSQKRRVAIYARVSTDDKGQDPENQLAQLREWCARTYYRCRTCYGATYESQYERDYMRALGRAQSIASATSTMITRTRRLASA